MPGEELEGAGLGPTGYEGVVDPDDEVTAAEAGLGDDDPALEKVDIFDD